MRNFLFFAVLFFPIPTSLSMEQSGLLLSTLLVYADRVAILRDILSWLSKQKYQQKKRQSREGSAVRGISVTRST